jgi:hypothetical protein
MVYDAFSPPFCKVVVESYSVALIYDRTRTVLSQHLFSFLTVRLQRPSQYSVVASRKRGNTHQGHPIFFSLFARNFVSDSFGSQTGHQTRIMKFRNIIGSIHASSTEDDTQEDSPMDLSVKKSPPNHGLEATSTHLEDPITSSNHSIHDPSVYNQLLARYLLMNPQFHSSISLPNMLPYLLMQHQSTLTGFSSTQDQKDKEEDRSRRRESATTTFFDGDRNDHARPSSSSSPAFDFNSDTALMKTVGDRKRISRPLTGRYVRHGRGASLETIVSLKRMLLQKTRMNQLSKSSLKVKTKTTRQRR